MTLRGSFNQNLYCQPEILAILLSNRLPKWRGQPLSGVVSTPLTSPSTQTPSLIPKWTSTILNTHTLAQSQGILLIEGPFSRSGQILVINIEPRCPSYGWVSPPRPKINNVRIWSNLVAGLSSKLALGSS